MASRARTVVRALALPLAGLALGLLFFPEAPPHPSGAWIARSGMPLETATIGGSSVRWAHAGHGTPVVLLHGFASSIYTWAGVWPALVRDHEVLAIDLPPFGGSGVAAVDPAAYPALVLAVKDRAKMARASLVGNSLGGAIAIGVAAQQPARVDRLVLIDAAGYNFAPADRPLLLRMVGWSPSAALLERLPRRRALVRLGLRQVFHDPALVTDERVEEYLAPVARPGAMSVMQSVLARAGGLGFPGVVKSVRAPTLVLWGADDRWIPLAHASRFVADIPGARLSVLPECGHVPQEERPDDVGRLLAAFLGP